MPSHWRYSDAKRMQTLRRKSRQCRLWTILVVHVALSHALVWKFSCVFINHILTELCFRKLWVHWLWLNNVYICVWDRLIWTSGRACLDQLSMTFRSLIILCDHIRLKTRLVAIIKRIATLGINLRQSARLHWTVWVWLLTATAQPLLLHTNRTRGEGEGGEQQVSCSSSRLWVCVVLCVGRQ